MFSEKKRDSVMVKYSDSDCVKKIMYQPTEELERKMTSMALATTEDVIDGPKLLDKAPDSQQLQVCMVNSIEDDCLELDYDKKKYINLPDVKKDEAVRSNDGIHLFYYNAKENGLRNILKFQPATSHQGSPSSNVGVEMKNGENTSDPWQGAVKDNVVTYAKENKLLKSYGWNTMCVTNEISVILDLDPDIDPIKDLDQDVSMHSNADADLKFGFIGEETIDIGSKVNQSSLHGQGSIFWERKMQVSNTNDPTKISRYSTRGTFVEWFSSTAIKENLEQASQCKCFLAGINWAFKIPNLACHVVRSPGAIAFVMHGYYFSPGEIKKTEMHVTHWLHSWVWRQLQVLHL
jgi:hypothetical protein